MSEGMFETLKDNIVEKCNFDNFTITKLYDHKGGEFDIALAFDNDSYDLCIVNFYTNKITKLTVVNLREHSSKTLFKTKEFNYNKNLMKEYEADALVQVGVKINECKSLNCTIDDIFLTLAENYDIEPLIIFTKHFYTYALDDTTLNLYYFYPIFDPTLLNKIERTVEDGEKKVDELIDPVIIQEEIVGNDKHYRMYTPKRTGQFTGCTHGNKYKMSEFLSMKVVERN